MTSKPKPPKGTEGGAGSSRKFAYKSFSQKIASLKIDPVRRVRRYVDDEETEKSFFHSAFDKWVELNLTTTFSLFARDVQPLQESLPLILHHKDRIFDLLYTYIDKRDAVALEPLLDLLAHFAHDLGANFEPYLAKSVALLSSLVVAHSEFSTIEWSFSSLAYLLKYLSRLLAPDLRPIYDVLAPLLGRSNQKSFVIRFAAEALSFLVRKAKGDTLTLIIHHSLEDAVQSANNPGASGYPNGLMTMFYETCVSVDRKIHSRGPAVIAALLRVTAQMPDGISVCQDIIEGVLVALVHHTSKETFEPVLNTICEFAGERLTDSSVDPRLLSFCAGILYTPVAVRKGSRIEAWDLVGDLASRLLFTAAQSDSEGTVWANAKLLAVIIEYADLSVVISKCARGTDVLKDWQNGSLFLPFCEFIPGLGETRFDQFVRPTLQRFIVSHWRSYEPQLCLLIPRMEASDIRLFKEGDTLDKESPLLQGTADAIRQLASSLDAPQPDGDIFGLAKRAWCYLNVLYCFVQVNGFGFVNTISADLENLLASTATHMTRVGVAPAVGGILALLGPLHLENPTTIRSQTLADHVAMFCRNVAFLRGVFGYINHVGVDSFSNSERILMVDALVPNLAQPSHDLRRMSIHLLEVLSKTRSTGNDQSLEILRTIALVEDTPFTIANQRNLAMYVRKLGALYAHIPDGSPDRQIVPWYCFGLMTVKFTPLWADAVNALGRIAESNEDLVAELAFNWLSGVNLSSDAAVQQLDDRPPPGLTPFQCSNLNAIDKAAQICVRDNMNAGEILSEEYEKVSSSVILTAQMARSQALYVLCEIPHVAEKRSRTLVPMFLEWSMHISLERDNDDEESTSIPSKWSRKDRAAMLTLFSKFANSKVLFKSDEVYSSLLKLLTSGDRNAQSLALKCIQTWKIPGIKTYEDRLNNLLDDTLFRNELTHFVQVGEDESQIQTEHRATLMPVLLRLLYGRSLSRKNASSGMKGMSSTRVAVLVSLANFQPEEQAMFVDIALGDLARTPLVNKADPDRYLFELGALGEVQFSTRKQIGLVRMVEDLLKQLGSSVLPHITPIIDAVLYCLISSAEGVRALEGDGEEHAAKSLKAVRLGGFKCLNAMFHCCPSFAWKPYLPAIFDTLISPRLEKLPQESSQSVSSLLQLFSAWAGSKYTIMYLTAYNDQVIPKLAQCLSIDTVKDEVVVFIVQLLKKIVDFANNIDESVEETVTAVKKGLVERNIDVLLKELADILRKNLKKEVLEQCIETVALLAPFVSSTTETTQLVTISVFLLDQPSRRVNPKIKSDILRILVNALPNCAMGKGDNLYESIFRTVSSLFGFFRDRDSRQRLASVLNVFADRDDELLEVAELSRKLNSFSTKRLDQPDFEQRLEAFATVNEDRYASFNAKQWMPILHNMFFFIKDNEELAIRTNASYALKRFAEICGSLAGTNEEPSFLHLLSNTVLPVLRNGANEQSELIRLEYVSVIAHVVKEYKDLEEVHDMHPLLMDNDEEASFFTNILHIQQHRRLRALRRLAATSRIHELQGVNISKFLLPLIEHFVFDQADGAHGLAYEASVTIGAIAEQLTWQQYRALFKRYSGYMQSKTDLAKAVIRLVGLVLDALVRATGGDVPYTTATNEDGDGDTEIEAEEKVGIEEVSDDSKRASRLGSTLPERRKMAEDILNNLLPVLTEYLHQKDSKDSTVSLRVPVAISITKLLRIMPDDMTKTKLPGTLTDVCNILRSRAQDDRDMARKTLADIALLLGPEYFSFIIKELKGSLQRGYQLHVLSYTVHSILVIVVSKFSSGSLDYCVSTIVGIIMNDIFGVTGSEKDAEGYISKMKEIKSSKSYDSMDILATITTLPYLGELIRPIRTLLQEKLNRKMVAKIDELLRRITVGLLRNATVKDRSLLIFCYEIVQEVYKTESAEPKSDKLDEKSRRYLINLKAPSKSQSVVATSSHVFKLTRFALDILRTILGKHVELMTPENLAGFIPIMGDAILSKQEEVQIAAIRLLTTIVKVPLNDIDEGAMVFLDKAVTFIKASPSTNAEIAQASLKLIGAILRERRDVPVKDLTIGYLLTRVAPDLEEPHLQGVTFNFVKAVLTRKIAIPEVYDIMDRIAAIMVTNHTRSVRDLGRSLYFQFLMDYPQGKDRWKKQLAFMVKNLEFKHESGRKSVMDAMYLVVMKMGDNIIQDVLNTFFVPLAMVLVNDESQECREMGGTLLKEVFRRADNESRETYLGLLRTWVAQEQPLLLRVSLQLYGLYFDIVGAAGKKDMIPLMRRLQALFASVSEQDDDTAWELIYFGLQLWTKFVQLFSEMTLSASSSEMWKSVCGCLKYPHSWVRLTSSRLLGLLFADYTKSPLDKLPLDNGRGLTLNAADLLQITYVTSSQLNLPELSDESAKQVIKNLLFLGRCFYANKMATASGVAQNEDLDDIEEEKEVETALMWLVGRISGVIRSERNIKLGLRAKKYSLQWLAAMIQVMEVEDLALLAPKIILPLYNLTELPETHTMKDLHSTAQEILGMLQTKIGTTEYATSYAGVKQAVSEKRQERRHKRRIEAVVEPEMAAKRKARKQIRKKESRKEKNKEYRDYRRSMM